MAYELRLLWHTNPPPFMPYEPFLLGVGVVFNLLRLGGWGWKNDPESGAPVAITFLEAPNLLK